MTLLKMRLILFNMRKKHEIQLCPDYRTYDCPYTSKYPGTQRQECVDGLNMEGVQSPEEYLGQDDTHPFPDTTGLSHQPPRVLRSCLKQKEQGNLNVCATILSTGQLNEGGVASGQHHCFSTEQESEEEIQQKQLNIIYSLCLNTQTTSLHC